MKKVLSLLIHAAVLLAAFHWTHSTTGLLVTGLGGILLLDRYATRLLPWSRPVAWKKEFGLRLGYALVGAVGFYLMRPGIVPFWEAAYRGAVVSLVAFLGETLIGALARLRGGSEQGPFHARRAWSRTWGLGLTLAGMLALFVPILAALHPLHTVPKRTPAALGLAFEDVRFPTADGLELAGWAVPHAQARGTVIFCHGHGRNRGHVAGLLPTLHALGLNSLAFDFRGHGDSPGHTSTFGYREVEDLLAARAYVGRRFPGAPLFLVGVSLGAAVSLQALPQIPEVRGVWSEGCFSRLSGPMAHEFAWVPAGVRGSVLSLYNVLGWLDCGFWAPAINPTEAQRGVRVPIYFVHGRRDELVPLAEGEALYEAYTGPKGHWWVEGATHYDVRQRHRDEYLRRLGAFFKDCLADPISPR